jgi:hypothetical protein
MKIASTYYQHKRIHTGTWTSPGGKTLNQMDHVLVEVKRISAVKDIRTMRGPNCDSDHLLVKTILKQKLVRTRINIAKQVKWNQITC